MFVDTASFYYQYYYILILSLDFTQLNKTEFVYNNTSSKNDEASPYATPLCIINVNNYFLQNWNIDSDLYLCSYNNIFQLQNGKY